MRHLIVTIWLVLISAGAAAAQELPAASPAASASLDDGIVLVEAATPSVPSPAAIPPLLVESPLARVRRDLDLLQAALESYRVAHLNEYPASRTLSELVGRLQRAGSLDQGFQTTLGPSEFHVAETSYHLAIAVAGQTLAIDSPEGPVSFWRLLGWGVRSGS